MSAQEAEDIHAAWRRERLNDPRSVSQLIAVILKRARTESEDDQEEDEEDFATHKAMAALHYRATREVLDAGVALCRSDDWVERMVGARLLGELGIPNRSFPRECVGELCRLLTGEHDEDVLQAACIALSHHDDPRAIAPLLESAEHWSGDVRYGAVLGLTRHLEHDDQALAAMIRLAQDDDDEVRDWATFALGSQCDRDTPELRAALRRRLDDADETVRGEALVGLARRGEGGIATVVLAELERQEIDLLALEAAEELRDPRLYPALVRIAERASAEPNFRAALALALEACRPR